MELKEYIKKAVIDIREAAAEIDTHFASTGLKFEKDGHFRARTGISNNKVLFDIATTVAESSDTKDASKLGGEIKVMGIKVGGKLEEGASNQQSSEHVSRIQFEISINY